MPEEEPFFNRRRYYRLRDCINSDPDGAVLFPMKPDWIIAGLVLICLVVGAALLVPHQAEQKAGIVIQGSTEPFVLGIVLPESPETAPVYKVTAKDSVFEGTQKGLEVKASIPTEEEAPALAENILENYGGLPDDAILTKVERVTMKKYNTKTGVVEEEYPQFTQVIYTQEVNGAPVIGPGAEINIMIGENGELLGIEKAWRHLEYDTDVSIISAKEAYEKLLRGETLFVYQGGSSGKIVSGIKLGYYAQQRQTDQKYYTPVWIFYAAKEGKTPFPYPVDAMKK